MREKNGQSGSGSPQEHRKFSSGVKGYPMVWPTVVIPGWVLSKKEMRVEPE